ncbi:hypothetical protein LSH36_693g02094 [Paralvinella palmiformis]|uniref:dolichyl-phosphate-mannose--protein mannosyltransferase n=1 Tax=Paralvinella palmiformis TaxID=53620 RepID=A0AAD9J3D9_9ANNE|nr:hypothetical protein LSH36_693g02094 [Paralvinella palmiformis]
MKGHSDSVLSSTLRSYIFGGKSFTITTDIDVLKWTLFVTALLSRCWRLDHPRAVVFDEIFYGRFASMYINNIFYFDMHPPLGKMILALAGYIGNFDGGAKFDRIGAEYPINVPVWALRAVSALAGSLLVPVTYQLVKELGYRPWTAGLAALLIILDNALLTHSRFMLMEIPLILATSLALLSYIKFKKCQDSLKYLGVFSVLLILLMVGRDLWAMLPHPTLTNSQLWREFLSRILCLVLVPLMLYILVFYVHLNVLYKSGPHDDIMTSSFQASLEGGLSSVTKHQPVQVAFGSQITLRHTHGSHPCWLHSHRHVYPLRYSPTRGSSHQQQVTCYSFKDINNWWIVKHPNSHDVAAPMSPQYQEVSCYVDYNISFPAQNLWRVELDNPDSDEIWRTIKSHVRLIHLNTSTALKMSGRQLPDWGFHQLEVVADKNKEQTSAVWNVEEHRYTRLYDEEDVEKDIHNTDAAPVTKLTQMTFWAKFYELHLKMFYSKEPEIDHRYSSDPTSWPLMEKNIAYWYNPYNNAQIHLVGNLCLWSSILVCLLVYSGLLLFYVLRRHRACYDIEEEEWLMYKEVSWLLLAGYLVNYVPYYMTDQTLFLYHYLPALYFGILLTATLIQHIHHLIECMPYVQSVFEMLLVVWITAMVMNHIKLSVLSYGMTPLTSDDIKRLTWRDGWDFLHNTH